MIRCCVAVTVLVVTAVSFAAPVPKGAEKPEEKLRRLFGEPICPDGCSVQIEKDTLRIGVPEQPPGKVGDPVLLKSPRTARELTGDFTLVVTTRMPVGEEAKVNAWAGVYLLAGDDYYFEYVRTLDTVNPPTWGVWSEVRKSGRQSDVNSVRPGNDKTREIDTVTMRLVREGGTLTAETKYGKGEWGEKAAVKMDLPKGVSVGVGAGGTKGPFAAEFDEFTVTQPGKK